ncbi:MAG TPA: hypothetical protein VE733_06270 [Streptosporangiaceae bacterium]|jgi:hypothetical protein|nr:hypothetical protein [Streptosporangiaceae bacterium]
MTFEDRGDGIAGTARGRGEDVPLRDITSTPHPPGERVTWTQSITKPLRLNLAFDVLVTGDALTGISRAGRLPASKVTGQRA